MLGPNAPAAPADLAHSLAENREGRISDAQRVRIRAQMRAYSRSRGLLMALWPIIGLLITAPIAISSRTTAPLWVVVGVLVMLLPLVALLRWRVGDVSADLAAGRVESVTGVEAGRFVNGRTGEAYFRIGAVRMQTFGAGSDPGWRLSALLHGAPGPGAAMRAYYLPSSKLLVAVEPAPPA